MVTVNKTKTISIALAVMMLSACNGFSAHSANEQYSDMRSWQYGIEQNQVGEYVFCVDGDCPQKTRKILAETVYQPRLPGSGYQPEISVFFSLGSSRLGAAGREALSSMLPKLKRMDRIYLRGWADSVGGRRTVINKRLAAARAQTVKKWLKQHGVKAEIRTASNPACCNSTDTRSVVIRW